MIGLIFSLFAILCSRSYWVFTTVSDMKYRDQKYRFKEQSWSNRNLSTIPLGLDLRLRGLDLSNNEIEQLNMLNLRSLERLDMSYNHLNSIHKGAFKNLFQLHYLNLARNALNNNIINNSKAFRALHGLRSLDISLNSLDNEAVKQYLSDTSSLEHLTLTGNSLTKLTPTLFTNNTNLRSVNIENNQILEIDEGTFEPLTRLAKLNLARNNLVYICDFQLHRLSFLNLSRNSIEFFITPESEEMYHLEVLDLSYNNLLYFPVVPKKNHLRYLHLQNNKVGTLGIENSVSETKSLYKEITNREFDGVQNDRDIYSTWKLMSLVYLDLSANHFRSFPLMTLSNLLTLETLNFSDNCLQNISHDASEKDNQLGFHRYSLLSLRYFDLQHNGIQFLPSILSDTLPKIETLILQGNDVKPCFKREVSDMINITNDMPCVSFRKITTLKHLDLQENGIKMLSPNTFEKTPLVSLNLAGNKDLVMASSSLEGLQDSLESLSIARNNMTSSHLSLECMRRLRVLNVSDNNFNDLPNSIGCTSLRELDMRNNNITFFEDWLSTNLSFHLDVLHISGNVFNCCNTRWLKTLYEANVSIPDLDKTECFQRIDGSNMLYSLTNHSIQCPNKNSTLQINIGQIIIIVFVILMSVAAIVFVVKISCPNGSFII